MIEIVYYTHLKVLIKKLTRIGRAKEEPIEIINLNLDSPVSPEITKFWAFSVRKEPLQILSRNYFIIKGNILHYKAHTLTGCDVTSKTGSKSAACKACPEKHLHDFGEDGK